jgi:hypothetical protein
MNSANNLSVIHPDDTKHPTTPVLNMPFDESMELRNSDYMSSEVMEISDESNEIEECDRLESEDIDDMDMREDVKIINNLNKNLGDGKFEYIVDENDHEMLTNAWQAITQTNSWIFMAEEIESFMFSNHPKIYEISRKMEELGYSGHSGCSFGYTMRNMQYLAQKGEEQFKKLFRLDELKSNI